MKKNISLTRQQLYEEVWNEPMIKVAVRYGISDVGLKKVCKRNNIPVPGRGYWRKVETGQKVKRLPLPKDTKERPVYFQSYGAWIPDKPVSEVVTKQIAFETQMENVITVKPTLHNVYPLVQGLREEFEAERENDYGRVKVECAPFVLNVGKKSAKRVILIVDALLRAFEQRGFEIKNVQRFSYTEVQLMVQDEPFDFVITESVTKELLSESSRKPPHSWYNQNYIYNPNGILALEIATWSSEGFKKKWRDKQKLPLEAQLNDFIIGLVKFAEHKHAQTLIRREEERQRQLAEQRRQVIAREQRREEASRKKLVRETELWFQSKQVRTFIENVAARASQEERDISQWLAWATAYANEIDPLVGSEVLDKIIARPDVA
jgi:hypothetical protein